MASRLPAKVRRAQARQKLLRHIAAMSRYWATIQNGELDPAKGGQSLQDRLDGLAFSILVAIDGGAAVPGYVLTELGTGLVLNGHPEDGDFHDVWHHATQERDAS